MSDNTIKQINESNINYLESIISKENIKHIDYYSKVDSLILDITFIYLGNRFAWTPYEIGFNCENSSEYETYIHYEWHTKSEIEQHINKDIGAHARPRRFSEKNL
jgi:hypothetical protein